MLAQQRLSDRQSDMMFLHTNGPFRANIAVDGTFQLGAAVQAFHPGEAFGWDSGFCVTPQTELLMQVRLVHLDDNRVLLYRERNLPTDAHGCSAARWNIVLPLDAPPGRYQLQRFLLMTPPSGPPRSQTLPSLAVNVSS